MGECWNCSREVILRGEETRCDHCKKIVRYWCNSCKEPFDVQDKNSSKLPECKWCYYFKCPNCGACGENCLKKEHELKVRNLLQGLISIDKYNLLDERIQEIIYYFEVVKGNKEQTNCEFGVPKTYAKDRIKSILAKMKGFRVRNEIDQVAFEKRHEEVLDEDLEYEFTIGNTRDAGTYGQEFRDVFNLCVCMGTLKYEKKKFKDKGKEIEYDSWTRIEKGHCPFLDTEELIVKYCDKCKKVYSLNQGCCTNCIYTKNTKHHNKGDRWELKEKLSNNSTCKNLGGFKKRGNGESEFEGEIEEDRIW